MPSRRGNGNQAQGNRRGNYLDRLEETNGNSVKLSRITFFNYHSQVLQQWKRKSKRCRTWPRTRSRPRSWTWSILSQKNQLIQERKLRLPLFNSFTFGRILLGRFTFSLFSDFKHTLCFALLCLTTSNKYKEHIYLSTVLIKIGSLPHFVKLLHIIRSRNCFLNKY